MASEQRLINANAYPCQNCEVSYCYQNCKKFIAWFNNTVDAVEVVHGEWEKQQGIYSCSICGKACPYDVQADIIQYWPCNYCPSCGAKMDGNSDVPREN